MSHILPFLENTIIVIFACVHAPFVKSYCGTPLLRLSWNLASP